MSRIPLGTAGVLYVMSSAAIPGMLKIGATTLDPTERARQLTASTSSPLPFHVLYSRMVTDVNLAENAAHEALADCRVNDGREFFQCDVARACLAVDRVAASPLNVPLPWSEMFATFPNDGGARELTSDEQRRCRELATSLRA